MPKRIAVIDGNSLMHRAYHAVPPTMNAPDGTPTNAVFGFMAMFLKFYDMAKPDAVVCAFDAGRPAFRMEALETYKAQRPPMDQELRVQFPIIEGLLEAMNVPVVKVPGWEGDDVLGTVSARDEELGYETLLVSGDKDVYQLVTDRTSVVTTKKGITDVAIYGPDEVRERYGVGPEQFIDFLGLKGDSSDNIPGVPGIGDKTAAKLLQTYGSIDGIYDNLDKLKGKQLQNLTENRDAAYLSRSVATIVRDLDFELDLEDAAFPAFDPQTVTDAFRAVRFSSHLEKVLSLAGDDVQQVSGAALALNPVDVFQGQQAFALLGQAISAEVELGVQLHEPAQASLFETVSTLFVATDEAVLRFDDDEVARALASILANGSFCAMDAKEVLQRVCPTNSVLPQTVRAQTLLDARFFDIGLAAYLLNSNTSEYTYAAFCEEYLGKSLPAAEDDEAEAVLKARVAPILADALRQKLDEDGSLPCYNDVDLPLVSVLVLMERTGARIDAGTLQTIGRATKEDIEAARKRVHELAGEEFNVDSPMQLSHILFEVLGLPHGKKTQRGYSTDAATLKKLQDKHPIAGEVIRYRELAKMQSTYIEALPRMQGEDGRVHTHFNQKVTATGRLSSSEPNLQNIPVRTDFGRRIRECFVPLNDGDVFVSADYSQIELRLLAHLSEDEHLVDAFCSGADFHAATAARVFGVPVDQVTPQLRSRAKAVNFGIVYGQQAFGLAQSLEIPFYEAQEMIDRYFEAYPGVRAYLDRTVAEAKECGFATTMFGRKRHIPELKSKNPNLRGFGERTAMNHPMQGSAADIIKLAMNEVQRRLVADGYRSQLMLQVHDELDLSVPVDELERLSAMVGDVMGNIVKLKVPLVVDVQSGENWAQSH